LVSAGGKIFPFRGIARDDRPIAPCSCGRLEPKFAAFFLLQRQIEFAAARRPMEWIDTARRSRRPRKIRVPSANFME
jgi:hypothetical protein